MTDETKPRSTLAMLREQVPQRPLTGYEVRHVLDRQATRLLKLSETFGPPVPVEAIATALPRVVVKRVEGLPSSGRAQWNGAAWVLLVDAKEAKVRQRYSLAHELAHVIWHPLSAQALPDTKRSPASERIESAWKRKKKTCSTCWKTAARSRPRCVPDCWQSARNGSMSRAN